MGVVTGGKLTSLLSPLQSYRGQVIGVASGITTDIITYTAVSSIKLLGFNSWGTADGLVKLLINGIEKVTRNIDVTNKDTGIDEFPSYLSINVGDIIRLSVMNTETSTGLRDYFGFIYWVN